MQLMLTHIYYLTLLVLTAVGSSIATLYAPAMTARLKRLFTRKKRYQPSNTKPCGLIQLEVEDLQKKVADLEEQVNNLAEQLASRDRNRKGNIRRDVRDYLTELKTK